MPLADTSLNAPDAASRIDKLLSAAEAARLLGLQPSTIYDLVQKGQIPYIRLFGKTVRLRESAIQKIINDSEVEATSIATLPIALKRRHNKPNGKATPDPSLRRRGRGPEAVN
jgi:excisionase family DNA binding protein